MYLSILIHAIFFIKKTFYFFNEVQKNKENQKVLCVAKKKWVAFSHWKTAHHCIFDGFKELQKAHVQSLLKPRRGMGLIAYIPDQEKKFSPLCRSYDVVWSGGFLETESFLSHLNRDHPSWLIDQITWGLSDNKQLQLKLKLEFCHVDI